MLSQRHNGYLDAARASILDVGWRRTTLTEVARRAGVSRMTIYRQWPDMPTLLGDLMTREWAEVVSQVVDQVTGPEAGGPEADDSDPATLLADRVVATVRALRGNELFVRIVELDPELLLPYLLSRPGRSQDAIVARLAESIEEGQRHDALRRGEPAAMARAVVLAAHGFVLSAHTMLVQGPGEGEVSEEALDAELRLLVSKMVSP